MSAVQRVVISRVAISRVVMICAAAVATATVAGCAGTVAPSDSGSMVTGSVHPVDERSRSGAEPAVSGDDLCDALDADDLRPLTGGEVTGTPSATGASGLPGCRWPVAEGYGWLEISVVRTTAGRSLGGDGGSRFAVGEGTAYLVGADGPASCQVAVRSPQMPAGYGVTVALDAPLGRLDDSGLCASAAPQISQALDVLGW